VATLGLVERTSLRSRGSSRVRDGRLDQYDRYNNRRDRFRYWGGRYGYSGYQGRWRTGMRYPYYANRGYYISDYGRYGLAPPWRGYRYYRTDSGEIVMAAIATGLIGLIASGALDGDHHDRYDRRYYRY
jgi:Ni/Co efflux regulator RcnB